MLECKHLTKAYPGKGRALRTCPSPFLGGRSWACWGEQGAGKTTLLLCLLGLLRFRGGGHPGRPSPGPGGPGQVLLRLL